MPLQWLANLFARLVIPDTNRLVPRSRHYVLAIIRERDKMDRTCVPLDSKRLPYLLPC